MNRAFKLALAALCLAPVAALAQDASISPSSIAVGVYQWSCANPSIVEPILESVIGGIFGILGLNATLKKFGFTKDSPVIGGLVWLLRKISVDVKPPDSVIVKQAAVAVQASPEAMATGASPTRMMAASVAIAKAS